MVTLAQIAVTLWAGARQVGARIELALESRHFSATWCAGEDKAGCVYGAGIGWARCDAGIGGIGDGEVRTHAAADLCHPICQVDGAHRDR